MSGNKLILTVLFTIASVLLLNSTVTVTDIYHKDYEIINRTVIVTSEIPRYEVEQSVSEKEIIVTIENAERHEALAARQIIVSPVLERIQLDESVPGILRVVISTKEQYYLEYFYLDGYRDRIVLDIFNKEKPQTIAEKIAFIKFFVNVGYTKRAEPVIKSVLEKDPQRTGVNYYLGRVLLSRQQEERAIDKFALVNFEDEEYLAAQVELIKQGVLTYEYDDETGELFSQYRDYFLRAEDINRQQMMLALMSLLFGNKEETRSLFLKVDDDDPAVTQMLANMRTLSERLVLDEQVRTEKPSLVESITSTFAGPSAKESLVNLLLLLLLVLLTAYIITVVLMKKKMNSQKKSLEYEIENMNSKLQYEIDASESEERMDMPENETGREHDDPYSKKPEQEEEIHPKEEDVSVETGSGKDGLDIEPSKINDKKLLMDLAFRLYNQGWEIEAIAKELNTTIAEVEWFLSRY